MATATAKLQAQSARTRDALFLPFKRRIASLSIRADNWNGASKPADAKELARNAIQEVDEQVAGLGDLKFPADLKPKPIEEEIDRMKASYASIRQSLEKIASAS